MSYATVADWAARFGILDENLDPVVVTNALEEASRTVDGMIGVRDLEPQTHTNVMWTHRSWRASSRIWLPHWPPREAEKWTVTLTSLALYDGLDDLQETVTVGDCTLQPELRGRVILPENIYVYDRWTCIAAYTCGYGTVAAPDIPWPLVAATLDLAEARVGSVLTVGRRVDRPAHFVEQSVRERLAPWRVRAAA